MRGELEQAIAAHPWVAIGAAFSLGAITGLAARRSTAVAAAIGALGLRILKSYAVSRLTSWIDAPSSERSAARDPAIETLFEH